MSPLMITKLFPPRIGCEWIKRPRILNYFSQHKDIKLILVTAPAGYGKTVSILQYVNSLGIPFVWYQLDQYDNDPAVFIQYLITGIKRYYPGFGTETLQHISQSNIPSSIHLTIVSLINELVNLPHQELVLVLDDYHMINAPSIHQFMQDLLEYLPAGIRIIIASRIMPSLNISRFQVSGELMMIYSDTLRFTTEEALEFITQKQPSLSQAEVDLLMAKTDGWPAALKLFTGSLQRKDLMLQSSREAQYIYDYLANEVFNQQPEQIRTFLISTAILEIITPEMCDLLLDRNDSQKVLETLEKQQLFLVPLTGQNRTYRYHQLFRDFLLERLGPQKNHLLQKAGKILTRNGDWEQAIQYLASSGNIQDLIPLIKEAGRQSFRQGRWQSVEKWLEKIPGDQIITDQWLCLFQAKINVYRGKLDEAEGWIQNTLTGFTNRQDLVGIAECQFLEAKILNSNGRYQESLNLLANAYPILQKSEPSLRFDLPLEKALLFIRMGCFRQAEELLQKGLQVAEKHDESWITAHFLEGLGNTYYMLGEYPKALEYYQKATNLSPNGILPGYCPDFMGFIYQELDDLEHALEYIQKSIKLKERMEMVEALLPAYYQLSSFYIAAKQPKKAEKICHKAIDIITKIGGQRFFLVLHKTNLAWSISLQGRLAEAQELFEETLKEAKNQSGVAWILCQMLYASVHLMTGYYEKAEKLLLELLDSFQPMEFAQALAHCYTNLAIIKFIAGDLQNAAEYSHKLLALKSVRTLLVFYKSFDNVRPILRYGLENEVEIPLIQRVLILLAEQGLNFLTELAAHPSSEVRARIIYPLSQINSITASKLLQSLAKDPDPKLRRLVKQCLSLQDDAKYTEKKGAGFEDIKPVHTVKTKSPVKIAGVPFLQIKMLGPVRIILNDIDITGIKWRFTKSRDLLFYLAHQGSPVGINQILEDLWPEVPMEKSINLFYSASHWLRRVIQKDSLQELITYVSKTCQLLPEFYTTDREQFISLIEKAGINNQTSAENPILLEEAVALYQGEYLSPLDYPWVITEREHLKRLYLETAIRLTKIYLQKSEHLKIVKLLEPLIQQHPLREELCSLLMIAYAGLGDRVAIIRQYHHLKSNLAEELGLEPAPEITKLYYELCGSDSASKIHLKNP